MSGAPTHPFRVRLVRDWALPYAQWPIRVPRWVDSGQILGASPSAPSAFRSAGTSGPRPTAATGTRTRPPCRTRVTSSTANTTNSTAHNRCENTDTARQVRAHWEAEGHRIVSTSGWQVGHPSIGGESRPDGVILALAWSAVRRVDLPPFLVTLLEEVLAEHNHAQVFASTEGKWHRRSNFSRRAWRPAVDGDVRYKPGTVFHGLRHLHKSVLIEANVPRVLQFDRLGNELGGVDGIYSHVTEPMRARLMAELERR